MEAGLKDTFRLVKLVISVESSAEKPWRAAAEKVRFQSAELDSFIS